METEYREMVARREAEYKAQQLLEGARGVARHAAIRDEIDGMRGITVGSRDRWDSFNELRLAAAAEKDNVFEVALAAFRHVIASQNASLLPAFDTVANAARDAETKEAYWNAIEALWDVGNGHVKTDLDRVIFEGAQK